MLETTRTTKDYYWRTADRRKIPMMAMDKVHLLKAHFKMCVRELELFNQINVFSRLREELEEVAKERNIDIKYPDELNKNGDYGNYFCNIRKTNKVLPMITVKPEQIKRTGNIPVRANISQPSLAEEV